MPVLVVALEPSDFEQRLGVTFHDSFDNLDYLKVAVLQMPGGPRIAIIRHRGSPTPGTDICLSEAVFDRNPAIVAQVLETLDVRGEDIVWSRGHGHEPMAAARTSA